MLHSQVDRKVRTLKRRAHGINVDKCTQELVKLNETASNILETVASCVLKKVEDGIHFCAIVSKAIEDIDKKFNEITEKSNQCSKSFEYFLEIIGCLNAVSTNYTKNQLCGNCR